MIYLDNNATTQPTAKVVEAMLPYLTDCYFNASASTTAFTYAEKPLREASSAMANLLRAEDPGCFAFTSGATESNNWVLSSLTKGRKSGRIVISAIEHASVAEPSSELARAGFEIIEIPVDDQGVIQMKAFRAALREDTLLVSIMAANNETGVLEPIAEIGRMIREYSHAAVFHTDATQAIGKIPIDLQSEWQDVDLLSFSAHKFHGPKGIGGVYIRPGIEFEAMLLGGGQQRGLRSGTLNTPALAGLASAAKGALHLDIDYVRNLRDTFEVRLMESFPQTIIHSKSVIRLPNTSFFSLPGTDAENVAQLLAASGIIVGTGAACSSGAIEGSKTLRAMGVQDTTSSGGMRVSLSQFSTVSHLDALLNNILHAPIQSAKMPPTINKRI